MANYTYSENVPKGDYEEFVKGNAHGCLLQSYDWAMVKDNWSHLHTGVYDGGKLVCTGLVLIRQLPLGRTLFYLPRGPVTDFRDRELLQYYFSCLKASAKKHGAVMIKFDPLVRVNTYKSSEANHHYFEDTEEILENLRACGARHYGFTTYMEETTQPRFISNVYWSEDPLSRMPKSAKRNIHVALRHDVQVVQGSQELVEAFSGLVKKTEERQNVYLRDEEYYRRILEAYGDNARIFLGEVNVFRLVRKMESSLQELKKKMDELQAEPEGTNRNKRIRVLQEQIDSAESELREYSILLEESGGEDKNIPASGALCVIYGKDCENIYAGTDLRFKKIRPQYLTWLEGIRWAFDHGCANCSLGGVEGTLDDGLTKFKDNFAPVIEEMIGEFDIPVSSLYGAAEAYYRHRRKKALEAHLSRPH